jgi:hypothetical protein
MTVPTAAPVTVPVSTPANLQVTGITLMAPPLGNVYSQGIRSTAVPTVPPPTTAPGPGTQVTLTIGQWIMDPTGNFVLILENNQTTKGLSLYRVMSGSPTSGSFQGTHVFGPVAPDGAYFLAQSDGNACVYPENSIHPSWAANNGTSGSAQYLFVQENGCFVEIQCKGIWGSNL